LSSFQNAQDRFDYSTGIAENIVVPKPDHFPTLALQPSRSASIGRTVCMLTAVGFDDEMVLGAREIDDVTAYWMLVTKFELQQTPIAQSRPHASLGVGRGLPKLAGFRVGH
jgi:hypothetical protein